MPAQVDYRLGSIFDEPCDILVIPSSAGGTVSPSIAQELRAAGIPFPLAMPWGTISLAETDGSLDRLVVYAATVQGTSSSPEIVEKIGAALGSLAAGGPAGVTIAAPLLGSGSGDQPPAIAAGALARGFLSTAPDSARLVICIPHRDAFDAVLRAIRLPQRADIPHWASLLKRAVKAAAGLPSTDPQPPRPLAAPAPPAGPAALPPVPPTGAGSRRTRVFISYAHADEKWLRRLQRHLRPIERDGALVWDDTRIQGGDLWREEIREALAETKVAVLLVSADFMASEFINTNELPPLLAAAEEEGATILPVIISASSFDRTPELCIFQAINDPEKPLAQLRGANREKVLDKVARAVEEALKR